jgi:hypothetical protein
MEMEYLSPDQARFARLVRRNRFLSLVLGLIVIVLLVFVAKHALLAWISVEQSGMPSRSVTEIFKAGLAGFFESFGELSGKYLLLVALVLLMTVVGTTLNVLFKFAEKRIFYFFLLIGSVVIGFNLPMDALWADFLRKGRTAAFLVSLGIVAVSPYVIASYLARDAIGTVITRKLLYIVVLGLLLVQMLIE